MIDAPAEGKSVCFDLRFAGRSEQGFAIRHGGVIHAYLNRCPHTGTTLDWVPGRFFSENGETLVCQTHGAMFAPTNGACLSGPRPTGLTRLPLHEQSDDRLQVPAILADISPSPRQNH